MSVISVMSLSCVRLFVTPWTAAHQALLSMGFSRQEYWSGLLCPPPGDLPNPGIEPWSPALQADALPWEPSGNRLTNSTIHFLEQVWIPIDIYVNIYCGSYRNFVANVFVTHTLILFFKI